VGARSPALGSARHTCNIHLSSTTPLIQFVNARLSTQQDTRLVEFATNKPERAFNIIHGFGELIGRWWWDAEDGFLRAFYLLVYRFDAFEARAEHGGEGFAYAVQSSDVFGFEVFDAFADVPGDDLERVVLHVLFVIVIDESHLLFFSIL